MVTALFVVSSVGLSTRGLKLSLEVALESVGQSVRGWVGFIGGGSPPVCVVCVIQLCFVIRTCNS
jgi:hypothetical protein